MKRDDKELDEYIRKEKAYYQHQRSLRQPINGSRPNVNSHIFQDSKTLSKLLVNPESFTQLAMAQQNNAKNMYEGARTPLAQGNGSKELLSQQQFSQFSFSPQMSIDQDFKSRKSAQTIYQSQQKDGKSNTPQKILKSVSYSQNDFNSQIKIESQDIDNTKAQSTMEIISQEKLPDDLINQVQLHRDLFSRNSSLALPKTSGSSSKSKYINGGGADSLNTLTNTAVNFKTKRNSMQNLLYLTPLQTRAHTPTSTQALTKNDISYEASEGLKSQSNLQKALNNFGISQRVNKDQKQLSIAQNSLKKITQNDSTLIQQQLNNNLLQSKLSTQNKMSSSLLEDKKIQIESSILSASKAQIMEQQRVKQPNNFYSKFSQVVGENNDIKSFQKDNPFKSFQSTSNFSLSPTRQQANNIYHSNQTSPKSSNTKLTSYEMSIKQIKEKLQVQLLELIQCNQNDFDQEDTDFIDQQDWKFKKLQFPKEEYYQRKFDRMSSNIIKNRENNSQYSTKLFSILQNKDQIVVHTSQNKDLMHISERKDVISLAQWYEDMLNQVYNESQQEKSSPTHKNEEATYSRIFSDLQAIHQACISEIIRQISIQSVERGQLLKKVQENLTNILREAFVRQLDEKVQFQRDVHKEIQSVHKDCVEKIDYYIPLITNLTNELERKEAINKRILLEFRYLKKKNHKLEKFLKEGRKEYKNLQEDYNKLKRQLDDLKEFHVQLSTKQQEDQQKMSDNFVKQLEYAVSQTQQKQEQQITRMKQENQLLKDIQLKYEDEQKAMQSLYQIQQTEIDEIEEQAQKEEFVSDGILQNLPDRPPISIQQLQSTDRQIMEIEGLDGLKFVLASVGVQVDNDLIQRKEAETETRSYFTTNEMDTQTEIIAPKVVLTQQSQTPVEWLKKIENGKDQKNQKPNQLLNPPREDSIFMKSMQSSMTALDKSLLKIDLNERILADSPVNRYMKSPQSLNKFNIFIEAISDDKVEVKSEDSEENEQLDENDFSIINTLTNREKEKLENEQKEENLNTKKYKQTLENTLKASIEEDISDLHLILNSKQTFVLDVFQKIIDHDLLKENSYLKYDELKLFISDSKAFKYEENLRFRNIWNKCKLQLIEYVKSKISLAEKEVEIEEANKNLDFGNSLYEKLIGEYENVLEQISSNSKKININAKKNSVGQINPISVANSMNSIILETEDNEEEHTTMATNTPQQLTLKTKTKELTNTSQVSNKPLQKEESLPSSKNSSPVRVNKNKQTITNTTTTSKQKFSQPIVKKSAYQSPSKRKSTEPKQEKRANSLLRSVNNTNNTANDETISIDAEIETERPSTEQSKNKSKKTLSKIVNMVINKNKSSQGIQQISTQQKIVDTPGTISDDIIHKQIIQPKSSVLDIFKNYRFKKHKLRKKYGLQSSPNQDAAANFLQNVGYKIMSTISKKNKGAVFTEQNTRKYISLIYNDKIKQIKSFDKSNPLHNVAYDFFLNKFGFKKLAEKNLQQFLRSLQYHNHIERVKVFLRFFGIDHEINYDIDDFNFYINCLIQLDENLPSQFEKFSIYSIPKIIELLFKKFENKITLKTVNKIKSDIESLKFQTNEQSLKNKLVIDQDQALQCLLSAKIEEKKINIIALRPIYLAGDVDNDQVIGYDEFVMLSRHIEKGMSQLSIMQMFFSNTDLIDEITNEKTMSFQQFAQISVDNNLFSFEKQQTYLQYVEEWDQIKNIHVLKKYWHQKKDILRLRFVKTSSYKNFYRLMIQKIDDYFQSQQNQIDLQYYSKQSFTKIPVSTQRSHPSLVEIEDGQIPSPLPKQRSQNNLALPTQVLQQMDQEESEKQNISWLLYKLLDDESKRVIIDPQIDFLLPNEFQCVTNVIEQLASDNKFFIFPNKSKDSSQRN